MASCPSVNASASTVTVSPTVRLMGNRPQSISGSTPSMMTRCLPMSSFVRPSVTPSRRFAVRLPRGRRGAAGQGLPDFGGG